MLVLDRATFPRDKLCGEYLSPESARILDRLGVLKAIDAAGALVTPGTEIPDGMLALGAPAKVKGPLAGTPAEFWVRANPGGYQALAQRHKVGVEPA